MKKILKSTLMLLCGVALFTACADDNDSNPTLLKPTTFTLNTPAYANSIIDLATSTGIPFTWSQPAYGFPVAAEYQLQVSKNGNFNTNLADVTEEEFTTADYAILKAYYTTPEGSIDPSELSNDINKLFGWTESDVPEKATVYVRASSKTSGASTIYSNVVAINVVPNLVTVITYPEFIYEIGNESVWNTAYPMFLIDAENGLYQRYNWLDGGFKFRPNEGDWNGDFGQDPAGEYGDLIYDGEEDCNDPGKSFPDEAKPAGFYQINVDIVNMKWNIVPIETVSIIGGFNDWAGDVDMRYNQDAGCWEVTTSEVSGEYKFRANHAWDINWGGDVTGLTQDGANLNIDAGTHTFKLYLSYEGAHHVTIE